MKLNIKAFLSFAFTLIAFIFFAFKYPYHLKFQESLQMFLFTSDYATEVISQPGGIADYISRFIVQFFYYPVVGALIIALLLLCLQLITWQLQLVKNKQSFALSFIPAFIVWATLCDENGMLTVAISLLISMFSTLLISKITATITRCVTTLVSIPVIYVISGSLGVVMPLLLLIHELNRSEKTKNKALFTVAILIVCWLTIFVSHRIYSQSMQHLLWGIHYYRFMNVTPVMAWIAAIALVAVPVVSLVFAKFNDDSKNQCKKTKCYYAVIVASVSIVAVFGWLLITNNSDYVKEGIFEYDYLANTRQWQKIIDKADKNSPNDPYSVAYLNLALGMTGRMGDMMFHYNQNGDEGIMPNFVIDFTIPLSTSEVLYNIGMLNAAQRYVFEAHEAIPDNQKSSRCYRRLAEINMLKGNDEVARKYLKALKNTLFYKDWADETMTLVGNEEMLNQHDIYGKIKAYDNKTDMFMADNPTEMLINTLIDNPENKLAFDYLMASCLLNRNLGDFYEYFSSSTFPMGYVPPQSYQEALALMWVKANPSWDGCPWNLAPGIKHRMEQFLRDSKANRPAEYIKQTYGDTYWAYYFNGRQS